MVSTVWVNVDHGRDLHRLADHMTKLKNFTKEENLFSAILFSFQLMLEQTLTNLIVCLMISQKLHKKFELENETSKKIELIKHL